MRLLKRPGSLLATMLFVLFGAAFVTQVVPYRQIIDSQRQVSEARNHLAALEAENERLEADVAALQTEAEVERLAREKLGYVRPGETAYVVLDPPASDQPPPPPPAEVEEVEDQTWVERLWDFLTGADLAS